MPTFGHLTHLRVFIDPDLLQYDEVWAAAGTWHDGFGIEPHNLAKASEGLVVELKRGGRAYSDGATRHLRYAVGRFLDAPAPDDLGCDAESFPAVVSFDGHSTADLDASR